MKSVFAFVLLVSSYAFAQSVTEPAAEAVTAPVVAAVPAPTPEPVATPESTVVAKVSEPKAEKAFPNISLKSYGYFTFSQADTYRGVNDLRKYTRRSMDLAEIAFEGTYHLTPTSEIEFEVELEHGGVGSSMEFDPFEEFGEFETEVEKGGEVALPEFLYKKTFTQTDTVLKVGKFPLFISLGTVLSKPTRYAAVNASDLEANVIPYHWNEMGVQVEQKIPGNFTARLGLVSGLNSEFFRSYSWIGGGYQRQFENVNADDLATIASVEWGSVAKGTGVGLAYYTGNTTNNRYKKDKLTVDSNVNLWSAMANYRIWRFVVTGEVLSGTLENSDKVVQANATLGGLAKPTSFAPLGHKAILESIQLSYDVLENLTVYQRYEHVDTFEEVEGNIQAKDRYNVRRNSTGLMWAWEPGAFMKAQYAKDQTELDGLPSTSWIGLAVGFDIGKFN